MFDFFVETFIAVIFVITIVLFITRFIKNQRSPRLTVEAVAVRKWKTVETHIDNSTGLANQITHYFASFQVESGDILKFELGFYSRYHKIKEGTAGRLTFQGTRYLGFETAQDR